MTSAFDTAVSPADWPPLFEGRYVVRDTLLPHLSPTGRPGGRPFWTILSSYEFSPTTWNFFRPLPVLLMMFVLCAGVTFLSEIASNIMGNTICAFGEGTAMPAMGFLKQFRKELEAYVATSGRAAAAAGECQVPMSDTEQTIIDIIAKTCSIERDRITLDATLKDLDVHSLDAVQVLFEIEDRFDIQVPERDDQYSAGTVRDLVAGVESLVAAKAATATT